MTEQQPYEVVGHGSGFELRHYPPCLVAEVQVTGEFEQAGNVGFRPLVTYIGGRNQAGQSLAMTAPVIQESAPSGDHVIAFVLPSSVTQAPQPTDERVTVREIPAHFTAVSRYSGRWSQAAYVQHAQELMAAIMAAGLAAVSEPRFARFDPPFKPWFLRRNEVHIDVADPTGPI